MTVILLGVCYHVEHVKNGRRLMLKMHDDEVDTRIEITRRLLAAQFPSWRNLPLEIIHPAGTDNAMYRLGDDKVVRMGFVHGCGSLSLLSFPSSCFCSVGQSDGGIGVDGRKRRGQ